MSSSTFVINVDVPDLAAAERFYTAAFDLRRGRRLGDDFLELIGWPVPLYLLRKAPGTSITPRSSDAAAASLVRDYARHWTPVHIDVVVTDLDAALPRALAAGASLEAAPRDAPYGRLALLADPFGHGLCLVEFNARGYDAIVA